ncbi:hypothetical protein [Neotabrizicola shimadae]|uniref:Uncharacterized protein n=1 Tax=Neotabrizicola shimadae TaxID=2807096 RepID=A0A8G0ZSZ4_9RHOB|nr:hypothetical protein [Neotabrizicola shimadae]QYZ68885.1 hypothetical protein JO391_14110 [Neotabrizicola shimadae]
MPITAVEAVVGVGARFAEAAAQDGADGADAGAGRMWIRHITVNARFSQVCPIDDMDQLRRRPDRSTGSTVRLQSSVMFQYRKW